MKKKRLYTVLFQLCDSVKGETWERVKTLLGVMDWWMGSAEWVESKGFLGQWNYSVYYNDECMDVITLLSKPIGCTT